MPGFIIGAESPEKLPYLGDEFRDERIQYLWRISKSEEVLCTILVENALLTHDRKHNYKHSLCWNWEAWGKRRPPYQITAKPKCRAGEEGWFWRTHTDWGLGVSDGYHRNITEDERYKNDWKWNFDKTYELWSGGTVFYGKARCSDTKNWIEWKWLFIN